VLHQQLDSTTLKIFSSLNDSMILFIYSKHACTMRYVVCGSLLYLVIQLLSALI